MFVTDMFGPLGAESAVLLNLRTGETAEPASADNLKALIAAWATDARDTVGPTPGRSATHAQTDIKRERDTIIKDVNETPQRQRLLQGPAVACAICVVAPTARATAFLADKDEEYGCQVSSVPQLVFAGEPHACTVP